MVVSPKDPPGSFSCLGIAAMPERTLRGVRVWCWPRVPTEAMGWTVGTRGTHYRDREQCPDAAWQAWGPIAAETVIRPLKPDVRSGAEHPVVNQRPAVDVGLSG